MTRAVIKLTLWAVLVLGLLAATPGYAAPKAELWPRWEKHDPASTQTIDHTLWDRNFSSEI